MTMVGVLLLAAALAAPSGSNAPAKRIRIAVLDVRPLAADERKAELLGEIALTEAASIHGLEVIGKSDINAVLGFEKQKQVIGCGDDSTCLAEIGGALGVEYILVGSLGTIGDLFRLDLKLVDARKARVRSRAGVTVEGQEGKLVAAVQKAVRDLLTPLVHGGLPPPIAAGAGAKAPADLAASPRAAGLEPAAPAATPGVSASATTSRRTWAYVTGGAGVALLAGGIAFGLQARSAFDAEKKAAASGDVAAYDSNKSKVSSMSTLADACFVAGAAGVGIGTWLYLTSRPGRVALDVAPVPGGAVASLAGGF